MVRSQKPDLPTNAYQDIIIVNYVMKLFEGLVTRIQTPETPLDE